MDIEQRAKELQNIIQENRSPSYVSMNWNTSQSHIKRPYIKLARHVEILILEAEIKQLETLWALPGRNLYIVDEIAILKFNLSKLKENEHGK